MANQTSIDGDNNMSRRTRDGYNISLDTPNIWTLSVSCPALTV